MDVWGRRKVRVVKKEVMIRGEGSERERDKWISPGCVKMRACTLVIYLVK